MKNNLVILAAGASSRMKRSQATSVLSRDEVEAANTESKTLLKVGHDQRPLLDYLLMNAEKAGYTHIYLIVPPKSQAFTSYYGAATEDNLFRSLKISYATQQIPEGRSKPMGTGDALMQTLAQYPILQEEVFTVCNSDNLYSVEAMQSLLKSTSSNAFIAYDREGLHFSSSRIASFALLSISVEGYLTDIIEKPDLEQAAAFEDASGRMRVSMNLWKLNGSDVIQYLKELEPHPLRNEKELPTAILHMIRAFPKKMKAILQLEHVPDLTSKEDIAILKEYIRQHYDANG